MTMTQEEKDQIISDFYDSISEIESFYWRYHPKGQDMPAYIKETFNKVAEILENNPSVV